MSSVNAAPPQGCLRLARSPALEARPSAPTPAAPIHRNACKRSYTHLPPSLLDFLRAPHNLRPTNPRSPPHQPPHHLPLHPSPLPLDQPPHQLATRLQPQSQHPTNLILPLELLRDAKYVQRSYRFGFGARWEGLVGDREGEGGRTGPDADEDAPGGGEAFSSSICGGKVGSSSERQAE